MEKLKYRQTDQILGSIESVKSINLWKSVIPTSYDILKAHGGEFKVVTKAGEGTMFTITI
jgi:hypothetical protein